MKCDNCGCEKGDEEMLGLPVPTWKYDEKKGQMIRHKTYIGYWCKECSEGEE